MHFDHRPALESLAIATCAQIVAALGVFTAIVIVLTGVLK